MAIIGISGKINSGKDTVGKIIQYLTTPSEIYSLQDWLDSDDINGRDFNWKIKKFAGKLKEVVSLLTGYSLEDLEKQEIKDTVLGKEWWYWKLAYSDFADTLNLNESFWNIIIGKTEDECFNIAGGSGAKNIRYCKQIKLTVRDLLQQVGTDAMRNVVHPNIWVNALMCNYKGKYEITQNGLRKTDLGLIYPNWIITDVRFENEAQAILDKGGILIRVNREREIYYGKAFTKNERGYYIIDENSICTITDMAIPKEYYGKIINNQDFSFALSSNHPSETSLDNYKGFKYTIHNNKSIDDLVKSVRQILLSEEIL